ncbi:type III secretion system inner membrane ring lipoprotein SctJ [Rhizobium paknamense]|uniref:type III secretion system inner membrane ring lipoprotein SctJ n=1 Tax=Rhizobium paknamense TaxID=1206817 RepID=UPI0027D76ED8|nr:type III secretion inner membrane ring lipoprotein SctJ [Rhizobium paknamense]
MLAALLCLSGCSEDALTGLSQKDALDAQILLTRSGIAASMRPESNGFTIVVDAKDRGRALELMVEAGLPREKRSDIPQLFPGDGFLVTPYEQRARLAYATEQQLAETLSTLDGVASARVHVVLPEDNGRGLIKEKARAAALLQYRPGADVGDIDVKSRAMLVNSVRGLGYDDVSVVLSPWADGAAAPAPVAAAQGEGANVAVSAPDHVQAGLFSLLKGRMVLVIAALCLAIAGIMTLLLPERREGRK